MSSNKDELYERFYNLLIYVDDIKLQHIYEDMFDIQIDYEVEILNNFKEMDIKQMKKWIEKLEEDE